MRWIDKPRKKTCREIVLEYMKFLKIMGYHHLAVKSMYNLSRLHGNYVQLYKNHIVRNYPINILMHNQNMINYLEVIVCNSTHLDKNKCIRLLYLLSLGYAETRDLTELLWSYFKEKHIANCIIIGDND